MSVADKSRQYGFDLNAHHQKLFGENSLPWQRHDRIPNSRAALNVAELARQRGGYDELHGRLMTGFWGQDLDIGDVEVLVAEGAAVGLDVDEVRDAATTHPYQEQIQMLTAAVQEMGGNGVPAFVIADQALIPGAQPHSLFEKAMDRLGFPLQEE